MGMVAAIIAGVVCLGIAVILSTPSFRQIGMLRPVALFFTFEGIWILADYLITRILPGTEVMQWIHYVGVIIFGVCVIVCLQYIRPKGEKKKRTDIRKNKNKNNDRKRVRASERERE